MHLDGVLWNEKAPRSGGRGWGVSSVQLAEEGGHLLVVGVVLLGLQASLNKILHASALFDI